MKEALAVDVGRHVKEAERLSGTSLLAEAQVHATLALVGIVARLVEKVGGDNE